MAGISTGQGGDGLNTELNLVPFIDLLSTLTLFLLITAVWTHMSRMDATAQVPGAPDGETTHVDLLRVRLDQEISAVVPLELHGVDDAPGVKQGGILEQITRELNVQALPTAIPESIGHDVGPMEIGETILLSAVSEPEGVTFLDDREETVVATLSPPRLQAQQEEEIEAETERVGEGAEEAESGSEDSSSEE